MNFFSFWATPLVNLASWTFPMTFQKKILKMILKRALGQFVDCELDEENMDLELSSGLFELRNVSLKNEAFTAFSKDYGLEMVKGGVGLLAAEVPLAQLWKDSVQIRITDCNIEFCLRPDFAAADAQELHSLAKSADLGRNSAPFDLANMFLHLELDNKQDLDTLRQASHSSKEQQEVYAKLIAAQRNTIDNGNLSSDSDDAIDGIHILAGLIERIFVQIGVTVENVTVTVLFPEVWDAPYRGIQLEISSFEFADASKEFPSDWTGVAKKLQVRGAVIRRIGIAGKPLLIQNATIGYPDTVKFCFEPQLDTGNDDAALFQSATEDFGPSEVFRAVQYPEQTPPTALNTTVVFHDVTANVYEHDIVCCSRLFASMRANGLYAEESECLSGVLRIFMDSFQVTVNLSSGEELLAKFTQLFVESGAENGSQLLVGGLRIYERVDARHYRSLLQHLFPQEFAKARKQLYSEAKPSSRNRESFSENIYHCKLETNDSVLRVQGFLEPEKEYPVRFEETEPFLAFKCNSESRPIGRIKPFSLFISDNFVKFAKLQGLLAAKTPSQPSSARWEARFDFVHLAYHDYYIDVFDSDLVHSEVMSFKSQLVAGARLRDGEIPLSILKTCQLNFCSSAAAASNSSDAFNRILAGDYSQSTLQRKRSAKEDEWQLVEAGYNKNAAEANTCKAESFNQLADLFIYSFSSCVKASIKILELNCSTSYLTQLGTSDTSGSSFNAPVALDVAIESVRFNGDFSGTNVRLCAASGRIAASAGSVAGQFGDSLAGVVANNGDCFYYASDGKKHHISALNLHAEVALPDLRYIFEKLETDGGFGGQTGPLSLTVDVHKCEFVLANKAQKLGIAVSNLHLESLNDLLTNFTTKHSITNDVLQAFVYNDGEHFKICQIEGIDSLVRIDNLRKTKPDTYVSFNVQSVEWSSCKDVDAVFLQLCSAIADAVAEKLQWLGDDSTSTQAPLALVQIYEAITESLIGEYESEDDDDLFFSTHESHFTEAKDAKLAKSIYVDSYGQAQVSPYSNDSNIKATSISIDKNFFIDSRDLLTVSPNIGSGDKQLEPFFQETNFTSKREKRLEWDVEAVAKVDTMKWNIYQGLQFKKYQQIYKRLLLGTPEVSQAKFNKRYIEAPPDSPVVLFKFFNLDVMLFKSNEPRPGTKDAEIQLSLVDFTGQDMNPRSLYKMFLQRLPRVSRNPVLSCVIERFAQGGKAEHRIKAKVQPLSARVDQATVDELTEIFSFELEPGHKPQNRASAPTNFYIQWCEIGFLKVVLDYKPGSMDYSSWLPASPAEMSKLFQIDQAAIKLPSLRLKGIEGIGALLHECSDAWTLYVKQTQLKEIVGSIGPIKSALSLTQGLGNLILLPLEAYEKDGRWFRGLQQGVQKLVKTTLGQSLKLGVNVAAGAKSVLDVAESKLSSSGEPSLSAGNSNNAATTDEQPVNLSEGLIQAYTELVSSLKSAAETIVVVPVPVDPGSESGPSSRKLQLKLIPVALLKPLVGTTSALIKTLQGAQNSLNPENVKDSLEKYK